MKVILLGFFIINSAAANTYIAGKYGDSRTYSSCVFSKNEVIRALNLEGGRKAIETTNHDYNIDDLYHYSVDLVSNIGARFYRWALGQVHYQVANSNNHLTSYYASGFENIRNSSVYLESSLAIINHVCDEIASDFRIIGEFQVDLKIGDRSFIDFLHINRVGNALLGKYIVPGSFESEISNLTYSNGDFAFTIHVKEGSDDYLAIFEGFISQGGDIIGKAFILPERAPLGEFTGKKLK